MTIWPTTVWYLQNVAFDFLGDYFLTTSLKVEYKNLNCPNISLCVVIPFFGT